MKLRVVDSNTIATGLRVDLGTDTDLYVAKGAIIARTDGTSWSDFAVAGTGSNQRADVYGTILGVGVALNMGESESVRSNTVRIHEGGVVQSHLNGATGVRMLGSDLDLRNDGMIRAKGEGVIIGTYGADTSTIVNHGTIESDSAPAISTYTTSTGTLVIRNYGEISGEASYRGLAVTEKVYNNGVMNGYIDLGSGDDLYDGRKGTIDGAVFGSFGKDTLLGGQGSEELYGGSENDLLNGGGGNDRLNGGTGADKLSGGKGADMFVFFDADESTSAKRGMDTIMDFSQKQHDKIDFSEFGMGSRLPASAAAGDDILTFIGTDKFHKQEGELRYLQKDGDTYLQADMDGNGKADFSIHIDGLVKFTESDFLL